MKVDVCVIGAGPAGLSAAALLAHHGSRVAVVDESPEPGGRLLGQLHRLGHRNDEFHQDGWWNGRRIAGRLAEDALQAGAQFLQGSSVWGIFPGWQVCVSGETPQIIEAAQLIITTGATEEACPLPGWTLPGVMSIGASQVLATQHRVRPGNTGIIVGINALSLAIANELRMSGVELTGVVNLPAGSLTPNYRNPAQVVEDLARSSHLAPSPILRMGGRLATRSAVAKVIAHIHPARGVKLWGIPINPRQAVTRIHGTTDVEAVTIADLSASGEVRHTKEVRVDSVFLAAGLRPLTDLLATVGCQFVDIPDLGGAVPLYGPELQTTVDGVYVAGNVTGIESAIVALAQGRLVAASIVDPDNVGRYHEALAEARRQSPIEFLPGIAQGRAAVARRWEEHRRGGGVSDQGARPMVIPDTAPTDAWERLPDELVVCRCEEITVGSMRQAAKEGASTAEEFKRFTRVTMGTCQGRVCQGILERIQTVVSAERPSPSPFPGHRAPVRPVSLGELARLACGTEEWERLHGQLVPSLPFDEPDNRTSSLGYASSIQRSPRARSGNRSMSDG